MSKKRLTKLVNKLRAYGIRLNVYEAVGGMVTVGNTTFPSASAAERYLRARLQQEQAERSRYASRS